MTWNRKGKNRDVGTSLLRSMVLSAMSQREFQHLYSPNDTQSDLYQGENQGLERTSQSTALDDFLLVTSPAQHRAPEIDTVHKLPVVHRSESFLVCLTRSNNLTQVNGQRSDIPEGVLVGDGRVDLVELSSRILHQVERREGVCGGETKRRQESRVDVLVVVSRERVSLPSSLCSMKEEFLPSSTTP